MFASVLATLSEMLISLPTLAEQKKIGEFLSLIDAQIENVGQQVEKMQLWKRGLLQKMMI